MPEWKGEEEGEEKIGVFPNDLKAGILSHLSWPWSGYFFNWLEDQSLIRQT